MAAEYKGLSWDGLGLAFRRTARPSGHCRSMLPSRVCAASGILDRQSDTAVELRPDQITALHCSNLSLFDSCRVHKH